VTAAEPRPDAARDEVVQAEGLRKSFPTRRNLLGRVTERFDAVSDVSFSLRRGETLALVGESGAGKSTVGRLILRLIEPDAGTVRIDGVEVTSLRRRAVRVVRRSAQMIFQDPHSSLDPRHPIIESVAEPLLVHFRTPRSERLALAESLLERVGIAGRRHTALPSQLSGGQLQRVAIARALALNPRLIVCDEAVSALDVSVQAQVLNLMKDLQEEFGLSYLFITHDLGLVEAIADRVVVMRAGRVVESGSAEQIFAAPVESYTRELLAAVPVPVPRSLRPDDEAGRTATTRTMRIGSSAP